MIADIEELWTAEEVSNYLRIINIGSGTEAKKFILQSVGRGVRIEPLKI